MLSELIGELRSGINRMRHKPFLEASMAAAALVALADGIVSLSERSRLDEILEGLDLLKLYDVHDAVDIFNAHIAAMETDMALGKEGALGQVTLVADDAVEADLVVRIALAIGCADDNLTAEEIDILNRICTKLGLISDQYLEKYVSQD
ncbi:TerB family tellurite resistance protein [Aestuariispira ectoiniformans]|uniref:TerB family tellurite resistance protein n=1 Tax=Aestuariispira ectoiniformans TaxID=2775080 RepID=UPI00223AA2CD|nr:TerB family tellurite resistance protein [Aestuariispira ectoiniformans]